MTDLPRPISESYWVLPGRFLAGEYPGRFDAEQTRRRIDAFLESGIDTFIDLTESDELETYLPILREQASAYGAKVEYHHFPIRDFGLPQREEMTRILDAIDDALTKGHKIYLHCWGGVGRTGTTVGCYLVRHGMKGQQALDQIAAWWRGVPKSAVHPRSPETKEQVQFILEWSEPASQENGKSNLA